MTRFDPIVTTSRPGELPDFSLVEARCRTIVDQAFRQRRIKISARRLQRWFRRYSTIEEFVNGPELAAVADPPTVIALFGMVSDLWNYTTRVDLEGRRPAELFLQALSVGKPPDGPLLNRTRFVPPGILEFEPNDAPEAWDDRTRDPEGRDPEVRDPETGDSGFTLVELLVSLTIIAVLAAMAVPALRAALNRADRTVCLSNLRQLGQAFSEFVADHGHYPAAELEVTDAGGRVVERKRWYHALGPYLATSPRAWSSGQGTVTIDPVTGTANRVVLPSEDDRDQASFSQVLRCPTVSHWEIGRNGAYGYNHQYLGDARVMGTDADGEKHRRNYPVASGTIYDRARTVVLIDSAGTGDERYRRNGESDGATRGNHAFTVDPPEFPERGDPGAGIPPTRWGSDSALPGVGNPTLRSRPDPRHQGGCCALFADGRAEWIPFVDLERNDSLWNGRGPSPSSTSERSD